MPAAARAAHPGQRPSVWRSSTSGASFVSMAARPGPSLSSSCQVDPVGERRARDRLNPSPTAAQEDAAPVAGGHRVDRSFRDPWRWSSPRARRATPAHLGEKAAASDPCSTGRSLSVWRAPPGLVSTAAHTRILVREPRQPLESPHSRGFTRRCAGPGSAQVAQDPREQAGDLHLRHADLVTDLALVAALEEPQVQDALVTSRGP